MSKPTGEFVAMTHEYDGGICWCGPKCDPPVLTNPLVIPASKLENITGAVRAVVDEMIVHGTAVVDRSHERTSADTPTGSES